MDNGSDGETRNGEETAGNRRRGPISRYDDSAHMRRLYTMTIVIAW